MKKLLIIILAFFSIGVQAQQAKKYAVKSGYIKLQLGGSTQGIREIWWDEWGNKTCQLEKSTTTTKMFGFKNTEEKNMCEVLVRDKFWVADYIEGTGTKGTIPFYQEGQDFANDMSEKEQKEFADQVLASMGGEKQGTETINGYTCDIIKVMGVKSWIYKGVALKTEGKIMGVETKEMVADFKPGTRVSSSKFNPPSGVEYDEMPQQNEEMSGGLGGLMSAFGEMADMEMEEEEEETVPVDYSYDKFKKIINNCTIDGYRCRGTNSFDGMHSATFMKGAEIVMVTLQSDENIDGDDDEYNSFKPFKYNGHTCRFGNLEEDNGTALIVEYPSDDMIMSIIAMPEMSKVELLKIEKKLQF